MCLYTDVYQVKIFIFWQTYLKHSQVKLRQVLYMKNTSESPSL